MMVLDSPDLFKRLECLPESNMTVSINSSAFFPSPCETLIACLPSELGLFCNFSGRPSAKRQSCWSSLERPMLTSTSTTSGTGTAWPACSALSRCSSWRVRSMERKSAASWRQRLACVGA
jgi:hypothetical protein